MSFSNYWKNLTFNAGSSVVGIASGMTNWRIRNDESTLVYKNPRYKSVAVHVAKQLLMSELEGVLNSIIPKFKKNYEKRLRETVLAQQENNRLRTQLIANRQEQSDKWGKVDAGNGHSIVAKDKYGAAVKEALMLYYKDDDAHTVNDVVYENGVGRKTSYDTNVVCHIDLAPQVSMSSSKNLVLTQVQGRDYTRKELVSGGDLQFSIKGNIVCDEMGVYPTEAVKKFVQIMEYNGILDVNFMMFEPFNVKKVVVKNYSLDQQNYKNVQPYAFDCVAIEPDDEVRVQVDTISTINKELELSPMNKWYKLVLDSKMGQMMASTASNIATRSITASAGLGLDGITTNI